MIEFALLSLHILCGSCAALAAPVAMVVHKGGNLHRLAGKTFFWAMVGAVATALVLGTLRPDPFLLTVALFTLLSDIHGLPVAASQAAVPWPGTQARRLGRIVH